MVVYCFSLLMTRGCNDPCSMPQRRVVCCIACSQLNATQQCMRNTTLTCPLVLQSTLCSTLLNSSQTYQQSCALPGLS